MQLMRNNFRSILSYFAMGLAPISYSLITSIAQAQIVVGHVSAFTGPFAARVKENSEGAEAYFKKLNAAGGINGQKIEFRRMDDENKPEQAVKLAQAFIAEPGAMALFMPGGTPQTDAIGKITDPIGFPVIAPSNGSALTYNPLRKSIFALRASYQTEAEKQIGFLRDLGYARFAVVYTDDAFGKDAYQGALRGFEQIKSKPLAVTTMDRSKPDINAAAEKIKPADADVLVVYCPAPHAVELYKTLKATNKKLVLAVISNNATGAFIKALGDDGRGTFVSQVMPSENSSAGAIQEMASHFPGGRAAMSPATIEGYVAAKLTAEAIRAAGKSPTPAKVIAALEGMKNFDLGGLYVSYSATDHSGLSFTELSMISRTGNFFR
jgi:branched-chain amino acid transport system substrate-binding protein